MVASLLYVFSPYVMVTVNYIEGDLPLAIGTALLPSLLWVVNRLLKRHQALDFMLIAIIVALTIFTVPIVLLQGAIAVLVLLIVEFKNEPDWTKLAIIAGAIFSGVLMSAFYWLPALLQYNAVTWHEALFEPAPHRITLAGLFALSRPLDSALTIHLPEYNLGWGLILALILNLPLMLVSKVDRWFSVAFFTTGLSILVSITLLTPDKTFWFVLIMFCFAISGSYVAQGIKRSRIHALLIVVIIIFNFVIILPFHILPAPNLPITDVSPASQVSYEQSGSGYAGIPDGLPLPSNLHLSDALQYTIANNYDENVVRLSNQQVVSPLLEESPYRGRYTIESESDITLTYNRAYFDNWQAVSSHGNLDIEESPQYLISVKVPGGTNDTVTFRQSLTRISFSAWVISLIAFISCIVVWWYRWQRAEFDYDDSILLPISTVRFFVFLLIISGMASILAPRLPGDLIVPRAEYSLEFPVLFVRSSYDRTLQLLAYELPDRVYSGGDRVQLTSFWNTLRPIDEQYLVRLRITDNLQRNIIYESDYLHPGYFPTNRYENSTIVPMRYEFRLPEDVPSGNHLILFDIYACTAPCPADARLRANAQGQIRISRPLGVD